MNLRTVVVAVVRCGEMGSTVHRRCDEIRSARHYVKMVIMKTTTFDSEWSIPMCLVDIIGLLGFVVE